MLIKRFLPKSLFGRVLMILIAPTVLIQLVVAYIFFDRHWDTVTRHISNTLAGQMGFFVQRLKKTPLEEAQDVVSDFVLTTGIQVYFDAPDNFPDTAYNPQYQEFQQRLQVVVREPFSVQRVSEDNMIRVRVQLPDRVVRFEMSVKRLESRTTFIFIMWMLVVSVVFLLIA
ncbi:MAG: hypothetical protein EBV03_05640, partial [Proteobacteria bacterium]|nr:hypothetical protein [Pseudomonadota bacterium]